jgi:hypothetical protein
MSLDLPGNRKGYLMSRILLVVAAIAIMLGAGTFCASAQDPDPFAGTTIESLGSMSPSMLPDHTLNLVKLTMEPGASIAMHHHPGPVVISVVSGEFTTSLKVASGVISRAATDTAEASTEPIVANTRYVLRAGDSMAYDADGMGHYMANEGSEPLVLMATVLWTTDADGFVFESADEAVVHHCPADQAWRGC